MKKKAAKNHGTVLPPVNPSQGLSPEEVQARMDAGLGNTGTRPVSRTVGQIIREHLLTYYNLVFAVLAALLIAVGASRDLTFLVVVVAHAVLGIIQGLRAKRLMDRLHLMSDPKVQVLRSGELREVSATELVQDDVVCLHGGIQIPADAEVLDGTLHVNEALLTGESDEIDKNPGDALLSGSIAVSGTCKARLTQVGANAYIARLTRQATDHRRGEASVLLRELNRLLLWVGLLILPMGLLLFFQQYHTGTGFRQSVVATVAAVLGMIPEGLYLLTGLSMLAGAVHLASNRVLVHDMKCIEALARVDLLCVDKTGTITGPEMQVMDIIPCDGTAEKDLYALLGAFSAHMTEENATSAALRQHFSDTSADAPEQIVPFSPERKYSGMRLHGRWYVLGAPEWILDPSAMTGAEVFQRQGFRVLAFARSDVPLDGKRMSAPAAALGWVLLQNPVRPDAAKIFTYFLENGVDIKVISGDHPETAACAAAQAGIPDTHRCIDCTALNTPEALSAAAQQYTVFGRVTPSQKQALIQALKCAGKTVGMVGDGINDVLAMRASDCSAAMASGSEAAAQIAQLVLLESDFSRMPTIVDEGRRIVNHIARSASLFLIKNIFSFLLAAFSLIFWYPYPLQPSQLSLVSLFTIGVPSFLLAMEPNRRKITGDFLPTILRNALPSAITAFLCAVVLVLYGDAIRLPPEILSTVCTLVTAFVCFAALGQVSAPLNGRRALIFAAMVIGFMGSVFGLHWLFALEPLGNASRLLTVMLCLSAVTIRRAAEWAAMRWRPERKRRACVISNTKRKNTD